MSARLAQLADFLESSVPIERFRMGQWAAEDPVCGFAGCAIGWAAHSGLFLGLRLSGGNSGIPLYEDECCYRAIVRCFRLPNVTVAKFLFAHGEYQFRNPTPCQVAARLRRFISEPDPR